MLKGTPRATSLTAINRNEIGMLVTAVKDENAQGKTLAQVKELDERWRSGSGSASISDRKGSLNGATLATRSCLAYPLFALLLLLMLQKTSAFPTNTYIRVRNQVAGHHPIWLSHCSASCIGRPGQTPTGEGRITDRCETERFCDNCYMLLSDLSCPAD